MTRFFQRSLPFLVALTAACGARSLLPEGSPPEAAGGAPTTTTSTTTTSSSTTSSSSSSTTSTTSTTSSSTGSGGAPPACMPNGDGHEVVIDVAPLRGRRPALVEVGGGVAVVFAGDASGTADPSPIADVVLPDVWTAWPPTFAPPHVIASDGGRAFAVAPRGGSTFALARSLPGSPPVALLDRDVDPAGTASSELAGAGGEVFALAITQGAGERTALGARRETPPGSFYGGFSLLESLLSTPVECASAAVTGHLFPRNGAFYTAISRSPHGSCAEVPSVLRIYPGFSGGASFDLDLGESARRVRVAPRGTGAWIVSQAHVDQPVSFVRVDPVLADGTLDPQFGTFHPALTADTDFDAVSLWGDQLLIAVIQGQGKTIRLVSVPFGGGPVNFDMPVDLPIDELALLSSPSGRGYLIAWTDRPNGGLHVRRVGC